MQSRRASPCLPAQAFSALPCAAFIFAVRSKQALGSFAWAHICLRMQSRRASPCLPSQAFSALLCAALNFATRSSQRAGSFAFEQSTGSAKTPVLAARSNTPIRGLSMRMVLSY